MKKPKTRAGEPVRRARLPTDVYVKKAVDLGRSYYGVISQADAARVTEAGVELSGPIEADVEFGRDGKGRPCANIRVRASGLMECQRCLEMMPVELASNNTVLIVDSWEDVSSTRSDDDVVVAVDERLDVVEVVLDELLVQIPFAPRHTGEAGSCSPAKFSSSSGGDGYAPGVAEGVRLVCENASQASSIVNDGGVSPNPSATNEAGESGIAFDQGKVIQPFANLATLIAAQAAKKE